jgi:hypothetical protein
MRNCWPRIPHYCNDIIKLLMLCWLNIEDEESLLEDSNADELKSELTKAASMLSAVMEAAGNNMQDRVAPLIKTEPGLAGLFRTTDSKP